MRHLFFHIDIGGDEGDGEVGVGGVKSEGMVDEGVMLVCARHPAACHEFAKVLVFPKYFFVTCDCLDLLLSGIGYPIIILLVPEPRKETFGKIKLIVYKYLPLNNANCLQIFTSE